MRRGFLAEAESAGRGAGAEVADATVGMRGVGMLPRSPTPPATLAGVGATSPVGSARERPSPP
jgi:hypothetical protein